jgi:cell division protein ZipA
MHKELQLTLSIIGILIIGGVLLHGIWTIRKNTKKPKISQFESRQWESSIEQEKNSTDDESILFDDVGVSRARVVNSPDVKSKVEEEVSSQTSKDDLAHLSDDAVDFDDAEIFDSELSKSLKEHVDIDFSDMVDDIAPDLAFEATFGAGMHDEKDSGLNEIEPADLPTSVMKDKAASQAIKDKVDIDSKEVPKQVEAPFYSNVVTQPKPEFVKAIDPSEEESFGQPPSFLLKKGGAAEPQITDRDDLKLKVSDAAASANIAKNVKTVQKKAFDIDGSTDWEPVTEGAITTHTIPGRDFSLNMQDGPKASFNEEPDDEPDSHVEKELSFAEQAKRFVRRNKKTVAEKIRKEPIIAKKEAEDQMRMDFNESQELKGGDSSNLASKPDNASRQSTGSAKSGRSETDVIVLNVRASDDNPISGASLLPMLLTLGFKFGEHDIFHRHVSTNGKGPILFSLTNMFKPGVFDIDSMENFNTAGLSLFMMLPIEGDPQQVFNMMHNAARKISDEFGCRILDGNKVAVSKQSLQQYIERIREFERRRLSS